MMCVLKCREGMMGRKRLVYFLSVFVSLGLLLEYLLVNAITAVVFKFEVNIAAQESRRHCHDVIFSG